MQRNRSLMFKRITGFVLIIVGTWVMSYLTPIIASSGLTLSSLAFTWVFVLFLALAISLFLDSGVRHYLKLLLIVFALSIPWSLIFLIQLPDESQFLLAVSISSLALLFYRRHYLKHKPQKAVHIEGIEKEQRKTNLEDAKITIFPRQDSVKHFTLRKAFGVLVLIVGSFWWSIAFLTIFVIGLLGAWLLMMPFFFIMFIGTYLISNLGLKLTIRAWITAQSALWLIPLFVFISLLPLIYEIISLFILGTAFVSFLYWNRQRYLAKLRNQAINPT